MLKQIVNSRYFVIVPAITTISFYATLYTWSLTHLLINIALVIGGCYLTDRYLDKRVKRIIHWIG